MKKILLYPQTILRILDDLQEIILVTDQNHKILHFNRAAEKFFQEERRRVIGVFCHKFFEAYLDKEICELFKEKIAQKESLYHFPVHFSHKKEKTCYISIIVNEIEEKTFLTILINEQLPSEFTGNILDSIGEALVVIDRNFKISFINKKALFLTGYTQEKTIGKNCFEIFKTNICRSSCILKQSFNQKKTIKRRDIFIFKKDGTEFPAEVIASPIIIDNKLIGGIEIFRDISFEIQMKAIFENVGDGVFSVDRHFHITSFNPALERITGYFAEEVIGRPCHEILGSDLCNSDCPVAAAIKAGKKISNKHAVFIHKSGKKVPVSITVAPLKDSEGRLLGAVETVRDLSEILILRKELEQSYRFGDILSKSPKIKRIFEILPDIAESESTVLITGESGTGKDIFARAIHDLSPRKNGPFVAVNCAAIPDTLLESELFGYKAGAFTDAKKDKPGRFALANGGTLFLDEIGEIPLALQAKLLRVLETKEFEPLGASKPEKVDVRIIAATNQELETLVQKGLFRQDLFYRINVARIHLPPLRERREDIPLLVEHFIEKFRASKGKNIIGITEEALRILMEYDFPGNVRELENIIEYCFIICKEGLIYPEHLPDYLNPYKREQPPKEELFLQPLTLEEIEKRAILQALKRNRWRKMATCRELGISKDTLRRKLHKYGISPEGAK
ncbi:sigma 54-interacting transcriptional regulator [Thermodesulfatator atlanticus]|uniref:sigma 54-interacting transcriptional regulator n=1 Tax=Thermodesulfatator atlanticus TaxID=501497 RepID=UPI0003B31865|nr:sigma 54-interacting transcriptional regulator [Thermodesulfatator atlanticus]